MHPSMADALKEVSSCHTNRKHLLQNASLVAHLDNIGIFASSTASDPEPADKEVISSKLAVTGLTTSEPAVDVEILVTPNIALPKSSSVSKLKSCFLEFGAGRGWSDIYS